MTRLMVDRHIRIGIDGVGQPVMRVEVVRVDLTEDGIARHVGEQIERVGRRRELRHVVVEIVDGQMERRADRLQLRFGALVGGENVQFKR